MGARLSCLDHMPFGPQADAGETPPYGASPSSRRSLVHQCEAEAFEAEEMLTGLTAGRPAWTVEPHQLHPRRGYGSPAAPALAAGGRDALLAASVQAEYWGQDQHLEHVDAKVAASLQAETWRQDDFAQSLQAEAWQVCSQRVTRAAGAVALPLQDASARPPTARQPQESEVLSAAGQLHWRLSDYGLTAREIAGDGACQFRAVADQLFGDQELHPEVRTRAVLQLRSQVAKYEGFAVGESFEEYLERMAEPWTWGDNLSLQAIADTFDIEACLVTTFLQRSFVCIRPASGRPVQQIWLGFFAEWHYTSLAPLPS